jgi:cytochrome c-type biogenesis protein CcmH
MVFRRNGLIENLLLLHPPSKRLRLMIFWFVAIAVTALACAALLYAARGRAVNAPAGESQPDNTHYKLVLSGIDADLAAGKIAPDEAVAARGELAREMLRARSDDSTRRAGELGSGLLFAGLGLVAVVSLGVYALLGSPSLQSRPLAARTDIAAPQLDMEAAITRIQSQLAANPDDLRGWTVLAPALAELGRFADAANAYKRIIALSEPTAELLTDQAEALLLAAGGEGTDEVLDLLAEATKLDANHIRAKLYYASELTRRGQYREAEAVWQAAIDLSQGGEPWLPAARQGLAVAQNDGVDNSAADQAEMIKQMVGGLSARLYSEGGSVEDWTQLLRSYLVLGERENAQDAYDRAVIAYPAAFDRGEMDTMALAAGLKLNGDQK